MALDWALLATVAAAAGALALLYKVRGCAKGKRGKEQRREDKGKEEEEVTGQRTRLKEETRLVS